MPSLVNTIVATLAAGGLVSAIPPRVGTTNTGTASLTQVHNPHFIQHGPIQLAKIYRKYRVPLSHDLRSAVSRIRQKRSTGSAVTTPQQYDVEYLTPVAIGSPAQVLNLDFDTGSSDLWVFSTETSKNDVNGQAIYSPNKSSTSKKLDGATWEIQYGDGSSSSGNVYLDKVTVGGLTVASQAVEAAKKVSDEFTADSSNDGLLGLGFSVINMVQPQRQNTFFDNAMPSLNQPVFTVDMKAGAPGTYNFGYVNQSAYTGGLTYTPVNSTEGFWSFASTGYAIGSENFKSTMIHGIADTGTTLLLLPKTVVSAYYKKMSGAKYDSSQGGYTFPCNADLEDLSFGLEEAYDASRRDTSSGDGSGPSVITIPGKYLNYAPVDQSGKTCFGGLQGDEGIGFAIFGDVALKAAFVVFDGGNQQIGWGLKNLD